MGSHDICKKLILGICAIFGFVYFGTVAYGGSAEQVFERVSPGVVIVKLYKIKKVEEKNGKIETTYRKEPYSQGSGVVIAPQSVVTNYHVVKAERGGKIVIEHKGKSYPAEIKLLDPERDICQLVSPKLNLKPVQVGSSKYLKIGQDVYSVGAPNPDKPELEI